MYVISVPRRNPSSKKSERIGTEMGIGKEKISRFRCSYLGGKEGGAIQMFPGEEGGGEAPYDWLFLDQIRYKSKRERRS